MQPTETIHRGMARVLEGQYSDEETRMRHLEELIQATRATALHRSLQERQGQMITETEHHALSPAPMASPARPNLPQCESSAAWTEDDEPDELPKGLHPPELPGGQQ